MPRVQAAFTLLMLTCVAGCSSTAQIPSSGTFEQEEWCHQVYTALSSIDIGWPVGNSGLSQEKADAIEKIFDTYSSKGTDDLNFASSLWLEKFRVISPYIIENNYEGYKNEVSEEDRQNMHLSSLALENTCQWSQDEYQKTFSSLILGLSLAFLPSLAGATESPPQEVSLAEQNDLKRLEEIAGQPQSYREVDSTYSQEGYTLYAYQDSGCTLYPSQVHLRKSGAFGTVGAQPYTECNHAVSRI